MDINPKIWKRSPWVIGNYGSKPMWSVTENVTLYEAKRRAVTRRGMEDGYGRIFMSRHLDP